MQRRQFIAGLASLSAVRPSDVRAQASTKRPLIGGLGGASRQVANLNFSNFLQGLHDYGYVEGKTISLVEKWADGNVGRQPALAEELVRLKPEVVVTANTAATLEVRRTNSAESSSRLPAPRQKSRRPMAAATSWKIEPTNRNQQEILPLA
jgi:putative ABC transport system substrate-binding protein